MAGSSNAVLPSPEGHATIAAPVSNTAHGEVAGAMMLGVGRWLCSERVATPLVSFLSFR